MDKTVLAYDVPTVRWPNTQNQSQIPSPRPGHQRLGSQSLDHAGLGTGLVSTALESVRILREMNSLTAAAVLFPDHPRYRSTFAFFPCEQCWV